VSVNAVPAVTVRERAGRTSGPDFVVCGALSLLAFALYGTLAFRLAQGQYLDYYNLAFDFDPIRTVDALASNPPDFLNVKHPLFVLLRPLAWPLLALGFTAKESAALVLSGFGASTVALCFVFLRNIPIERPIATALTLLFIVSGAQVFTSIIAETYGVAGFSIVLTWYIAQARLVDAARFRVLRYVAGVLTFGTTVTNVMQTFIAEMVVAWRWYGVRRAIWRCILFGMILAVPIVILCVAVWFNTLVEELKDPVLALKHVWWQQTKGPRAGPLQVLITFFGFSFVSPQYSWLLLPEGINMRDFRAWSFDSIGAIAAPLWLTFWVVGAVAALTHRQYRLVATGMAVALAANLAFHLDFQFRGSLYIYAAHMHFLIFALGAGLAPWLSVRSLAGKVYAGAVVLLALMIAANNLPIARNFVTDFDAVSLSCAPPCTEQTGQ
jgi:hypothetical protein